MGNFNILNFQKSGYVKKVVIGIHGTIDACIASKRQEYHGLKLQKYPILRINTSQQQIKEGVSK